MERDFISEITQLIDSDMPFTDIRLEQDGPIMVRLPNGWSQVDRMFAPCVEDMQQVLEVVEPNWEELIKKAAINRPIELSVWRLRICAYLAFGGKRLMMSIRRISKTLPTLRSVGLPPATRLMLSAQRGLILISGATRSGKSTSSAAMLDEINMTRSAHVITIEDPIEYIFEPKKSVFSQREVGVDVDSFEKGLEDAMRQCPDVILVGEIRNRETAETAMLAGESGHLVIGTLHANTAAGATQKLLSWFNEGERNAKVQALSNCLVGVVNQILLPKKDESGYALATEIINNMDQEFSPVLGDQQKLNAMLDRPDARKTSLSMADSLGELALQNVIDKAVAMRAVTGMPGIQDRLKTMWKV